MLEYSNCIFDELSVGNDWNCLDTDDCGYDLCKYFVYYLQENNEENCNDLDFVIIQIQENQNLCGWYRKDMIHNIKEGGVLMDAYIGPMLIGVICIVLGVYNTKGNIYSLHWYHRKRVSEEDRIPFGKMVGRGTIIIGISLLIFGGLSLATELLKNDLYVLIGEVIVIIGMIVGLVMNFYAMIKYNHGIF